MLSVVAGRTEIAHALRQTYSTMGNGVWSPVAQYCGGCPQHWGDRRWPGKPAEPVVPRLDHFSVRDQHKPWISRWPLANDNLLVIAVTSDAQYESQCHAVLRVAIHVLQPHTLVFAPGVGADLEHSVLQGSAEPEATWPFVDKVRPARMALQAAGENEVRLTVWGLGTPMPIPDGLWTSRAALEVLVIPDNLVHPVHPGRRLIDTTPHIRGEEIVNDLST